MSDPATEVLVNARRWGVLVGDCGDSLRSLPAGCVHTCVTSPPYYGLRSYLPKDHPDKAKEIGLEESPESYIARMVAVFREVKRVLRDDGTLWVNIADSYSSGNRSGHGNVTSTKQLTNNWAADARRPPMPPGIKPKDRIGIPHMLAFALRADGWFWRDEIVWSKGSPMPESVRDRTTRSHEFVFLFTKSARYFYDAEAIAERSVSTRPAGNKKSVTRGRIGPTTGWDARPNPTASVPEFRNRRSVWRVNAKPYKGSHYATFPPRLVDPCVLAGTSAKGCCPACGAPWVRVVEKVRRATRPGAVTKVTGDTMTDGNRDPQRHVTSTETVGWEPGCGCGHADTHPCLVLDPFVGSGTTLAVAATHGRRGLGCDLDERNLALISKRMGAVQPLLAGLE